jgi:hypothetical protein
MPRFARLVGWTTLAGPDRNPWRRVGHDDDVPRPPMSIIALAAPLGDQ